jgi:hypothetical protein
MTPVTPEQAKKMATELRNLCQRINHEILRTYEQNPDVELIKVDVSQSEYSDKKIREFVENEYVPYGWSLSWDLQDCSSDAEKEAHGSDAWVYYHVCFKETRKMTKS